jgi:hypothetical protein
MQTMVLLMFTTKCMWGLGSKWNGELVDLNKNGDTSWKDLMPQNKNYPIFSKLGVLLTNYLHHHWMDFMYKIIGDQNLYPIAQG